MSLVTRCTSCGTVFRVVQDQLKVSGGWVRCGKCGEVFNALQTLFDLERGQSEPPPAPPQPTPAPMAAASLAGSYTDTPAASNVGPGSPSASPHRVGPADGSDDAPPVGESAEDLAESLQSPSAPFPGEGAAELRASAREDAWAQAQTELARRGELDLSLEGTAPAPSFAASAPPAVDFPISFPPRDASSDDRRDGASVWPAEGEHSRWIEPDEEPDEALAQDSRLGESTSRQLVTQGTSRFAETPEFLRTDRAEQRWNTPLARGLMSFAALALGLLLLGQWAVHERDRVADSWPSARPLLAQWCRVAGCELLEAPRRLEAFTVESTALTRAAGLTDAYRLTITVRNRAGGPATLPSVELSLTDADGQLLSRRVLNPTDFRVQRAVIPPGGETTMQLVFTNSKGRINGYTIDLFYP